MMDYYGSLGLEPNLSLSPDDLQQRFYKASKLLHPDRFARASAAERQAALDASSLLNDAYRTLRDPVARAEYVLRQHGFDVGEQGTKDVPAELLEEVFELNMALEELKHGDESVRPQVEAAKAHFVALRDEVDAQLQERFRAWDEARSREILAGIRALLNRRKYISNLIATAAGEAVNH